MTTTTTQNNALQTKTTYIPAHASANKNEYYLEKHI